MHLLIAKWYSMKWEWKFLLQFLFFHSSEFYSFLHKTYKDPSQVPTKRTLNPRRIKYVMDVMVDGGEWGN